VSGHSPETLSKIGIEAYYLWEKAGYPAGDGAAFWIEAEKTLLASLNKAKRPPVKKKKAAPAPVVTEEEAPKSKKKKKKEKDDGKKKKKKKKKD
jgi:hypothetical protein